MLLSEGIRALSSGIWGLAFPLAGLSFVIFRLNQATTWARGVGIPALGFCSYAHSSGNFLPERGQHLQKPNPKQP